MRRARKQVAEGIGYDKEGNETTDPGEIMEGATKPFDKGFKGAGLALMVQIIGGALVGAAFNTGEMDNDGNVVIAINPDSLVGKEYFLNEVAKMKKAIKESKKLPSFDEVMIPGERGDRIKSEILESGDIEVENNLLNELRKVADQ